MAAITRRTALSGLLALAAAPSLARAGTGGDGRPLFASCVRIDDGRFGVAVVDETGALDALHPLPDRGHGVAVDPAGRTMVAFARRPGTFAVAFDLDGGRSPAVIAAESGRHFFGHGVFDAAGARLYATENDVAAGTGCIGVYDARDGFARIGEIATGGVGPHELIFAADGRTLAVANGGIATDPAFARRDLAIAGMRSRLTLVDAASGRIVAEGGAGEGLELLSIRHAARGPGDDLWFACQYQGDPTDLPPLVGRMDGNGEVRMMELPREARALARNYIGSIAVSGDGSLVAVASPRGGVVLGFDARTGDYLGQADLVDGCGLAPAGEGIVASAGTGRLAGVSAEAGFLGARRLGRARVGFDHHMVPARARPGRQ